PRSVLVDVCPRGMCMAAAVDVVGFMARLQGVPGERVDFGALKRVIAVLAALYVATSAFNYAVNYIMAGVSQRIAYDLRQQVNRKLSRLPLRFFDSHTHGEILSRVTNDVDNIAGTLQQSITQAITRSEEHTSE